MTATAPEAPFDLTDDQRLETLGYKPQLHRVLIAVVGAVYFFIARPDRLLKRHIHDTVEPTAAERHTSSA